MSSTPFFLYAEDGVYFSYRGGRADISQQLITTKANLKYVLKNGTRYWFKVVKPGQSIGFRYFISADFGGDTVCYAMGYKIDETVFSSCRSSWDFD